MFVIELLSALAVRPVVDAALRVIEEKTGFQVEDRANAVFNVLSDHLNDPSLKLGKMLEGANARAWKALEVALAGESLLNLLDREEDRAFRRTIRAALDADTLDEVVGDGDDGEFRQRCLEQLRHARSRGRLTTAGPLFPAEVFERASVFARFDDPQALLDAEWRVVDEMARALQDDYPDLARLLGRPGTGRASLLTVAVRYYFRRAVEKDDTLFKTLAMGGIESQGREHERRYAAILRAVEDHGDRLKGVLQEVMKVALKTHECVLDLRSEHLRQGERLQRLYSEVLALLGRQDRLDRRALRPGDSLSRSMATASGGW